jgi:hypothetical protein
MFMREILMSKLYAYLIDNNPDILVALQEDKKLGEYLKQKWESIEPQSTQLFKEGKPAYIIEELCLLF